VAVQKHLLSLSRIGLHEVRIRLRQVHAEEMDLAAYSADHADGFAKIHLRMAGWMRQRHEPLAASGSRHPDIVLHHRGAAAEAAFITESLKNPLR
jgi:hypothetical protein